MDDFEWNDPRNRIQDHCPECKAVRTVCLVESFNHGNILANCGTCDAIWDWTEIDHKAILAEARRGF